MQHTAHMGVWIRIPICVLKDIFKTSWGISGPQASGVSGSPQLPHFLRLREKGIINFKASLASRDFFGISPSLWLFFPPRWWFGGTFSKNCWQCAHLCARMYPSLALPYPDAKMMPNVVWAATIQEWVSPHPDHYGWSTRGLKSREYL